MPDSFEIRLLQPQDFSQVYRTFSESFSDYLVKMELSKDAFRERMEGKLNLMYPFSVGVFHGEKLIAFILNTVNSYENQLTAYNGGTGVLEQYRGGGLTQKMYNFLFPIFKQSGIDRCVLEVITNNEKAIRAYKKSGFETNKRFKCFKLKCESIDSNTVEGLTIRTVKNVDLDLYQYPASISPSFLDHSGQLVFNLKNEIILEARIEEELVGFAIFQHKSGRISQLGVMPEYRRKGVGSALLAEVLGQSENKQLTVLNIDENAEREVCFLKKKGFANEIDQWEMELKF